MNGLKLFVVAAIAAVMTIVGASLATANGNRLGAIGLTSGVGGYDSQPAHYRKGRRGYRQYRRHRRYRRHRQRRRHHRRNRYHRPYYYNHGYYGPHVFFGAPGFGFYFGH